MVPGHRPATGLTRALQQSGHRGDQVDLYARVTMFNGSAELRAACVFLGLCQDKG